MSFDLQNPERRGCPSPAGFVLGNHLPGTSVTSPLRLRPRLALASNFVWPLDRQERSRSQRRSAQAQGNPAARGQKPTCSRLLSSHGSLPPKLDLVANVYSACAKGSLHSPHRKLTPHSPLPSTHPSCCWTSEDTKVFHIPQSFYPSGQNPGHFLMSLAMNLISLDLVELLSLHSFIHSFIRSFQEILRCWALCQR